MDFFAIKGKKLDFLDFAEKWQISEIQKSTDPPSLKKIIFYNTFPKVLYILQDNVYVLTYTAYPLLINFTKVIQGQSEVNSEM